MTNLIIHMIFLAVLVFTIFLAIIDLKKTRNKTKKPLITFLIPCYNCDKTIERCIKSIFHSYKKDRIEMIAINDSSKDNTLEILKKLSKEYKIKIVTNIKNIGKTKSINSVWRDSKGDLIWIVDSDTFINKKSVSECLRRLYDEKVGAVSCRYKIIKNNFLSWMVGLEFNMLGISHSAYNVSTGLSLWGGCSVYKRKALFDINGLKDNMIVEDMDSALRLGEIGWKVEQCFNPVLTYSPDTLKGWFKQKVRWSAGGMQCFITHPKSFIKSPLAIFFTIIYSLGIASNLIEISYLPFMNVSYFTSMILMTLISCPYLLIETEKFSDIFNVLYLFFFVVIYYPLFMLVSLLGFFKGIYSYFKLKDGVRGW